MEVRASMVWAREMRGISSMVKLVMSRSARVRIMR